MATSILDSVKKALGLAADYDVFDTDIIMHINTVFNTLNQLGVGPTLGFVISDKTAVWEDFIGEGNDFVSVQTYTTLRVRLIFDPPATSYTIAAFENIIKDLEWRLNVQAEGAFTSDPVS